MGVFEIGNNIFLLDTLSLCCLDQALTWTEFEDEAGSGLEKVE